MQHEIINGELLDRGEAIPARQVNNIVSEDRSIRSALQNFYAAFNRRNVEQSVSNWAQRDNVVMCNPMGGIRRGIASIQEGYQFIMQGDTRVYVEFYDYELVEMAELSYVAGRERGFAKRGSTQLELDIRTSRIYQRSIGGLWQQIHHHGSMSDAKALQRYQDFLKASVV